ncbi:diacylglycerol/lipid kinase family protein [Marinifilum sp. RC60d5]|uniref:diacylglycerol/lipid kinase family protein n=1 Tax=Marinifilum sp. RC60d5 TaxID=3458414 RepID=UPI0040358611
MHTMDKAYKTLIIINPVSGTGKQKQITSVLKKYLNQKKFKADYKLTKYAGHGYELAKDAVKNGYKAIIAVGGDGTINEISRALAFSATALGIIPCGSGNGLARHLGIPMNPKKAIQWINKANIQEMDTISANEYRLVNVAGIGFDAKISHEFEKMNSRGLITYIRASLKCFRTFKTQEFELKNNSIARIEKGMMLSFCNSSQFGNNAFIAPKAKIDDGKINLCLLKKPKWYQVPALVMNLFSKRINSSSLFKELIVDHIKIYQKSDLGHVDGEPVIFGNTINLKIDPKSLKIFTQFNS